MASCANRMANHIRASPATNIKVALNQPKPPSDAHPAYHAVSTMTQQREFVEGFMRPILAACEDALQVGTRRVPGGLYSLMQAQRAIPRGRCKARICFVLHFVDICKQAICCCGSFCAPRLLEWPRLTGTPSFRAVR